MPKGTILEKLTFGDVLQSADQIIAHADALKVGFNFLGSLVDVIEFSSVTLVSPPANLI